MQKKKKIKKDPKLKNLKKKNLHKKIEHKTEKIHQKPHLRKIKKHIKPLKNKGFGFWNWVKTHTLNIFLLLVALGFLAMGVVFIWISTFRMPDFESFNLQKIEQSTKIYDRTGEILLFDINQNIKRTVVPLEEMGLYIQHATIAIEDDAFYQHKGVRLKAMLRALKANLTSGGFSQGGSTITQQIVKNTLLTSDKRISRKIKEIVIAFRVEKEFTKDEILEIYLNEAPYGGAIYGVKEAAMQFFGKEPLDLTIAEASYLAALPQAPTYYSPYGNNKEALEGRQSKVLRVMLSNNFITEEEYLAAVEEEVEFLTLGRFGIKAPHFVFMIEEYLEETFGEETSKTGGLKVITTINYNLQQEAERIVKEHSLENEELYNASNAALVAIDPTNGEILTLVGSRDYFDTTIDGQFNIATAKRQPGSSFKPFIYATAFDEGYTPETIVFDVLTEFQSTCDEKGIAKPGYNQKDCYAPNNYDGLFRGPITLRYALGQSRNIPAVKTLYLTGISDSITSAKNLGISTLTNANQYGLTLVLGGGEVKLLDMTSAYGVFANEGIKHNPVSILKITDSDGETIEEYIPSQGERVFNEEPLRQLNSVLSDNQARLGLFGSVNNFMYFGGRDVAGKTGTTNKNVDAWMMGYTPNIAVGVWSGNNDNTPMTKGSSISGRLWRDFMDVALQEIPNRNFTDPQPTPTDIKPTLRGKWLGGITVLVDSISDLLATEYTPEETQQEMTITNVHSILHWVNRSNPRGPFPQSQGNISQYEHWEYGVQDWWDEHKNEYNSILADDIPEDYDNIHIPENFPEIEIEISPENIEEDDIITIDFNVESEFPVKHFEVYINDTLIEITENDSYSFIPSQISSIEDENVLKIIVVDDVFNKSEIVESFKVDL